MTIAGRRGYRWLLLRLAIAGCLAAGLVASPASAAPGWSRPVDVSGAMGMGEESPLLNLDSAGTATAVWQQYTGGKLVYESAVRQAGGSWSAPSRFIDGLEGAYNLRLAVDPLGNETAVWVTRPGRSWVVQGATRPAGGTWSEPVSLSKPGAGSPMVAVDPGGVATAVWLLEREEGRRSVVQSATLPPGGTWSAPVDLSPEKKAARSPQVVLDPSGNATAVWEEEYTGAIQSASRPAGGEWSASVNLSATGVRGSWPQVVVDPSGNATAIWVGKVFGGGRVQSDRVQTATRPAGGSWSAPVSISAPGHRQVQDPQIAVDPRGEATAIWQRSDGSNLVIQGAARAAGGRWSTPVELTGGHGQGGQHLQLVVDSSGNATAVWEGYDNSHGTTFAIQAAKRAPGGAWSRPVDISRRTKGLGEPLLALDPQGRSTAIWAIGTKGGSIIQSATSVGG
jgi:hypothetical protein